MFSWLFGAGRPALYVLVLVGLFGGGAYLAWLKLRPRILASPEYCVGPEQVEITLPLPQWIHSDIRAEVFRDPTLGRTLSIMDDDLSERVFRAFAAHPWVAKVRQVTKYYPASGNLASVKVELVYRKPVCMVQVPGGVVAVDAEGVLLPSKENFTSLEATHYPLVLGIDRDPRIPAGQRWFDTRVVGGAEIAAAFGPAWGPLRLQYIEPLAGDPAAGAAAAGGAEAFRGNSGRQTREPFFALRTFGGTQILWGYAPRANVPGELPAAEKVALLQRYQAEHDTLDASPGQPRQNLDVRKLGQRPRP